MAGPRLPEVGWSTQHGYGPHLLTPIAHPVDFLRIPSPIDQAAQLVGRTSSGAELRVTSPWIPTPQRTPRLRPFVLSCPNCLAPTESPKEVGGVTRCGYCNVPMVWEPAVPLTRDDQAFRYDAPPPVPRSPNGANVVAHGLGPLAIIANSTTVLSIHPQEIFRPFALWISSSISQQFAIEDVRIGHNSVKFGKALIPCSACSEGDGLDVFAGQTLAMGMELQIHIANISYQNVTFHGLVRGVTLT